MQLGALVKLFADTNGRTRGERCGLLPTCWALQPVYARYWFSEKGMGDEHLLSML